MTTDARRLMRLGPAARKERSSNGHTRVRSALGAVVASGKTVFPDQEKLLLGLSRMKENFQVRFLEGGGLVTARFHSAQHGYKVSMPKTNLRRTKPRRP